MSDQNEPNNPKHKKLFNALTALGILVFGIGIGIQLKSDIPSFPRFFSSLLCVSGVGLAWLSKDLSSYFAA